MYRCWRPRNFTRPVFMKPSYFRSVRCCSIWAIVSSSTPTTIRTDVPPNLIGNAQALGDQDRQERDAGEEEAARERDPRQHPVDVVGGARARLHARNEPALLLQVFRQVHRVENDGRIEVAEEQDQHREREIVGQVAGLEEAGDVRQDRVLGEARDGARHDDDRLGEDDRHHAGGDQPDRDEGLLSLANPPAAHHLAGDLDGDAPRGDRHGHHGGDDRHQDRPGTAPRPGRSPRRS